MVGRGLVACFEVIKYQQDIPPFFAHFPKHTKDSYGTNQFMQSMWPKEMASIAFSQLEVEILMQIFCFLQL